MKIKLLLIPIMFILLLTGCNKNEDSSTEINNNYAKNEVATTEDTEDAPVVITDATTESTTTEEWTESENTYNVDEDINANNAEITNSNISIDGKMINFPCSYNDIKKLFGKLYVELPKDQLEEVDESQLQSISNIQLRAIPETGTGIISFSFYSDNKTSIDKCICNEISVSGNTTEDTKLMTVALPGNIKFGSTADDIIKQFGKVYDEYNNDDNGGFSILYKPDGTYNEYYFNGSNYGLDQFIFTYNDRK